MVNYKKPHNIYSQPDITRLTYLIKTDSPFEEGVRKSVNFAYFLTSKAFRQNIRVHEICIGYFTFPGIAKLSSSVLYWHHILLRMERGYLIYESW